MASQPTEDIDTAFSAQLLSPDNYLLTDVPDIDLHPNFHVIKMILSMILSIVLTLSPSSTSPIATMNIISLHR